MRERLAVGQGPKAAEGGTPLCIPHEWPWAVQRHRQSLQGLLMAFWSLLEEMSAVSSLAKVIWEGQG